MERQPVIDISVPSGGGAGLGTLVLEQDPVDVAVAAATAVAPPLELAPGTLGIWAWRAVVALAVLLAVAGLLAFASTPPV